MSASRRVPAVALSIAAALLASACGTSRHPATAGVTTTPNASTTAAAATVSPAASPAGTPLPAGPAATASSTPAEPAPATTAATAITTAAAPTTAASPTTAQPVLSPTSPKAPRASSLALVPLGQIDSPVDLTFRAGDPALYVVSKRGFIVRIVNGAVDGTRVLDVSTGVSGGSEQGLLGMTFADDGRHAYTDLTNVDGDTEIVEWAVGADGIFDPATRRLVLEIDQPFPNHNGGQVRIGPDGLLYIGMGDGGDAGDPGRRALDLDNLLGKILRIDPTPSATAAYSIPADNPFVNVANARPEIWSIGVRNPWRYSFDRVTNDLWIADVGQNAWEEIDAAWADTGGGKGLNFGWSAWEGKHRFNNDQPAAGVTQPLWEYPHGDKGCSISGGVRYRGALIPALYGWYVFSDYCSGGVRAIRINDNRTAGPEAQLDTTVTLVSEVAQGPDGELYVLSVDGNQVYALRPAA